MEARNAAAKQRPGDPVGPQSGMLVDAEIDELPAPRPTRVEAAGSWPIWACAWS